MRSLHLAIDADDVVVDFVEGLCESISRDFNVTPALTKKDITSWGGPVGSPAAVFDPIIGFSWWTWLQEHAHLWGEKFTPVPGALGGLEALRRAGHRVELLTAKPEWAEDQMFVWLGKYKPKLTTVTLVPVNANKTEFTDAQYLVDDRDKNVVEWVGPRPKAKRTLHNKRFPRVALLFDMPHNRDFSPFEAGLEYPENIIRVQDWRDVLAVIEREAE